jgi:hypothetical protein
MILRMLTAAGPSGQHQISLYTAITIIERAGYVRL